MSSLINRKRTPSGDDSDDQASAAARPNNNSQGIAQSSGISINGRPTRRRSYSLPSEESESDSVTYGTSLEMKRRHSLYVEPHHHRPSRRFSEEIRTELAEVKRKKRIHESRRVMFILGALIGLLAAIFITSSHGPAFPGELEKLVNFDKVSYLFEDWRDWKDLLPTGLQSFLQEAENPDDGLHGSAESFSVGKRLLSTKNYTHEFNVVLVPGVISTGLESWSTTNSGPCPSINHFRKRLWGSFYMLRTMILDKTCWLKHIMLDEETGLDPPDVKLRAAQGFESSDFFMAGYWIWNKILQNLAVIGYSPDDMHTAAYDWRLTYLDLERRDRYFSKLKIQIELTKTFSGKKSILVGHSMGSQVIFYFMKWVEANGELYGNGGPNWVNDHIEAFVDISGSSLGAPKTISALMSGEMKDTVQLNALAVYGLEQFFSRRERVDLLRSFGGIASMIPKGGDLLWGNLTYAPDDPTNALHENGTLPEFETNSTSNRETFGTFIQFKESDGATYNVTMAESIDKLLDNSPEWYSKRVRENYSFGVASTKQEIQENNQIQSKWSNPLEAALPNAPDLKVYCFYGVGKPTERAYTYTTADSSLRLPYVIDPDAENPVYFGDGDGTVSLLTHAMCHEWQKRSKSRFNPGNSRVTIVEIKHEPNTFDIRGGARTAEHVDILGSAALNELILTVAAGRGDTIQNKYVSDLKQIVESLNI
ncbi:LRO1 [[Candida] subhashii]|uniref:LRO1 n=1 Tax=[Candida] subhashii TaxID=561895 RepID=A0A8J5UU44_9ASCO|nr:LRO1 [[Candida] subhashii]KAG7661385.1 LRO1 [[Candida] subhashii]